MEYQFKKYLYITTFSYSLIFLLSVFIFPLIFGHYTEPISAYQLQSNSINITPTSAITQLLIRNIIGSFLICIIGVIGIELLPILILVWNAYNIGDIISVLIKPETFNMIYAIIPHAIIEIPAIILCATFSCNLALKMREHSGNKGIVGILTYKGSINNVIISHLVKPYLYYVLPLIVIGCLVESTISLYIMRMIFNGG